MPTLTDIMNELEKPGRDVRDSLTLPILRDDVLGMEDLKEPRRVFAKIRYNHKGEYCILEKKPDGKVLCTFEQPVRAATPGQAAVFYDGEYVLGGGTIIG